MTTVLGDTADKSFLDAWKLRVGEEEAKRISKEATDRGTMIHRYLECAYTIDMADDRSMREWAKVQMAVAADPTTERMARDLLDATRAGMDRMLATETPLWHDGLGVAGTTDAIGIWKGKPTLVDFKTSRREKRADWVTDYRLQCAFYAEASNRLFDLGIEDYAILITCETGGVQIFEGKVADHVDALTKRVEQWYGERQIAA